jgi:hypothetical protein
MRWKCVLAAALFAGAVAPSAEIHGDEETRVLIQQSLLARRPNGGASKPANYRPVSSVSPRSPGDTLVGITFWRLRTVRPDDPADSRLLVLDDESGEEIEQVPERIESGTPLKPGERIRLSVEVPRTGFLYIFDREQYADGTSVAHLIYPNYQTPRGDNAVAAGRLIEVPDRRERINSFKLVKSRPDHLGEVLVVMVAPKPLTNIRTDMKPVATVDEKTFAAWEKQYGLQVEHLELEGGAGAVMTSDEKKAGGDKGQLLSTADALPQSVFRVKAKPGDTFLIHLPIALAR